MRFLFFFLLITSLQISFSQCSGFQFAEIGYEPAQCRLYSYQSGNGVVYAAATGGAEPYFYQWTNLQTGMTSNNNTTWGGLNVGFYEIIATDNIGCVLIDTIEVDSITPAADYQILSSDFDSTGLFGLVPFNGVLDNICPAIANPDYPDSDTTFLWQLGAGSAWFAAECYEQPSLFFDTPDTFDISLIALNKNGCADTLTKTLTLTYPSYSPLVPSVFTDYATGQTYISIPDGTTADFILYESNGNVKLSLTLEPGIHFFQLHEDLSFYKIFNSETKEQIISGKLICLNH
jgi:hypothetical protein